MIDEDLKKRVVGILLRMPSLLIIELVFMGYLSVKDLVNLEEYPTLMHNPHLDYILYVLSWILLLLPIQFLIAFYNHLFCISCVVLSHVFFRALFLSCNFLSRENSSRSHEIIIGVFDLQGHKKTDNFLTTFLVQLLLYLLPTFLVRFKSSWKLLTFIWPLLPWGAVAFQVSPLKSHRLIEVSLWLSTCFTAQYTLDKLFRSFAKLKLAWLKMKLVIGFFGWQGVATWAQFEYQVLKLLMSCWFLRFSWQLYSNISAANEFSFDEFKPLWPESYLQSVNSLPFLMVVTIPQCLTTSINLFGLAVVVAELVKFQYFCIRSWLHWSFKYHPPDPVSGPMTGAIDGMTLLVMSLYIDLLNTKLQTRFLMINYILFTIGSSQFQSFFNIIDPILMGLATANNGSTWKNVRTVLISIFLLIVSGAFSYLCLFSMRSTFWVFILAYNYLNTFSLMLGSLLIYCVLTFDYIFMRGWDNLEDVMFYIRGACRAVEFCITLGMCVYIMWTFYSEMTSIFGFVMLALYTYCCIVQRGGKGWKIWTMRRNAVRKVCSLPLATDQQIAKREDNCAICLLTMEARVHEARMMHCGHIFHENCLKKWFYIQDKCPLCYTQFRWDGVDPAVDPSAAT